MRLNQWLVAHRARRLIFQQWLLCFLRSLDEGCSFVHRLLFPHFFHLSIFTQEIRLIQSERPYYHAPSPQPKRVKRRISEIPEHEVKVGCALGVFHGDKQSERGLL